MIIADGKRIANNILAKLKKQVSRMKRKPRLAVVLVGRDLPSQAYVRNKQSAAKAIGIEFFLHKFDENISEPKLIKEIQAIQEKKLDGIIIQLPLPKKFNKRRVLNALNPDIDVDCLSWISLGKLMIGEHNLVPPSPAAILEILKFYKVDLQGKHVVLVGQGELIGKPLTNILVHMPLTLTICNKDTKNLKRHVLQADIVISGVGKRNLITADMIKKSAVVIDAGVSFDSGKMYGDTDFEKIKSKASLITPTPGGVGPITVAKLLENTIALAKSK